MPGKSRHQRGKYSAQSRRKKGRPDQPTKLTQPAAAQTHESISSPNGSAPSTSVPTPMAKPAAVRYPYIATELRTIGILAGIMLIVLAVLALVLS